MDFYMFDLFQSTTIIILVMLKLSHFSANRKPWLVFLFFVFFYQIAIVFDMGSENEMEDGCMASSTQCT